MQPEAQRTLHRRAIESGGWPHRTPSTQWPRRESARVHADITPSRFLAMIASYEDSTIAAYRNRISSARVRSIVFVAPGSTHGSSSVTRTSHCSG